MKRKLTKNIPLKIMSLAVGVLVWLLVVNIDNPITTRVITINNVQLVNEAYLDDFGKMCVQEEDQDAIRVTIKGERKTVEGIKPSDITAVADVQQSANLNMDSDLVMVPIYVTCDKVSSTNIEVTPRNLSIHLEDKKTQEFVVSVSSKGDSRPGRGYEVGTLTSNPEKIKITGPASLINKIDKVSATVDVSGSTSDVVEETEVTIIDKNGEELDELQMSYLNVPKVTVTAKLWKVRSNVKIHADYVGEPAEGYEAEDTVTVIPDVVSVAGPDDVLEELSQMDNTIWIPAETVDISGQSKDYEQKVNIAELLPEGLTLTSDSSEDVFVQVSILPEGSLSYDISTKDIAKNNLADDMQVMFETDKIEIRIKGVDKSLDDLDETKISASIDLKDKGEGSYKILVSVELPDGYELVESPFAEVKVSEISSVEQSEE
ncbi:MAG: CdaR family protein [Eubacteriales bacterium]|nr:CdaR family protein [Eubacteriales bacterium]